MREPDKPNQNKVISIYGKRKVKPQEWITRTFKHSQMGKKRMHRQEVQYAFKATDSETENENETEVKEKLTISSYEESIKALTAQLQEQITANAARWSGSSINQNMEGK